MESISTCSLCSAVADGHYCKHCGHKLQSERLTVKGMLHEVFHFFTHFDKGFPFTFKALVTGPGKMQRKYVGGIRDNFQKPFSMFFICATFSALALYWINTAIVQYFNAGDSHEVAFFHQYWVIYQICMLPVYSLISWFFFKSSGYNYAEITVFQLYTFSMLFLMITSIHLLKFIWPDLQTRYIEFPVICTYTLITNFNFFTDAKWLTFLKTILVIGLCFFIANTIQDVLVKIFS